jgi:hypothetical protein
MNHPRTACSRKDLPQHVESGEVVAQQLAVARVLALARRLVHHVPCQAQAPHRDQAQQQHAAEWVSVAECRGNRRHPHEAHTPGDVDDVVAPDAPAHEERDPVGEEQDRQCRTGNDEESHVPAPVGANVHW